MDATTVTLKNIGKNLISLTASELVGRILGAVVLMIVPRYLGPSDYGVYALAVSFFALFSVLSNYGLNGLFIKDVARDKTLSQEYYCTHIVLKELLSLFTGIALVATLYTLNYPARTIQVIAIVSLAIPFDTIAQTNSAAFRAYEKMEYNALLSISRSVVALLGAFVIVRAGGNVYWLATIAMLTTCLLAVSGVFLISKKFFRIILAVTRLSLAAAFRSSTPFFLVSAMAVILGRVDVLMLSKLGNEVQVGLFSAANELVNVLYVVPNLVATALFPVFSRQFHESSKSLVYSSNLTLKYIVIIGFPMSAGIFFVAPQIIPLFYGTSYAESIVVLQILGAGMCPLFVGSIMAYVLTAADRIRHVTLSNVGAIILHAALNVWLIPMWGARGAAVSAVIVQFIAVIYMYVIFNFSFEGIMVLRNALKPLAATLIMSAVIWWSNTNLIFTILLGALTYGVAILSIRTLGKEEILMIKEMIPFVAGGKPRLQKNP